MNTLYLDIETVPLPVQSREFTRPNPDDIRMGNLKDVAKIEAKIAAVRAAWESGDDCALDPLQGRVALIGYAVNDEEYQHIEDDDEFFLLRRFCDVIEALCGTRHKPQIEIVGHNIRFDAGFIVRRGWMHDATPPQWLVDDLYEYHPRYWRDTMQRWQLGDKTMQFTKLTHICGAFGIKAKQSFEGITGANFHQFWAKPEMRQACIEYNRNDVEAVRTLWDYIGA